MNTVSMIHTNFYNLLKLKYLIKFKKFVYVSYEKITNDELVEEVLNTQKLRCISIVRLD